jgi:hypothetical protein
MDLPIACTLTEAELRDRRRTVLDSIRNEAVEVTSLSDGYAYHFKAASQTLQALSHLVDLERQCCPFLSFKIVVESNGAPIRLEVTGPPEAKPMIADFLGGL